MAAPRPRVTRRGTYNPARYTEWKRCVWLLWGDHFVGERCAVSITLPEGLRGDLDNYAKAVLDALAGVAFPDDSAKHVWALHVIVDELQPPKSFQVEIREYWRAWDLT